MQRINGLEIIFQCKISLDHRYPHLILLLVGPHFHRRARRVVVPALEIEDVADAAAALRGQLGGRVHEPRQERHHVGVVRLLLVITCREGRFLLSQYVLSCPKNNVEWLRECSFCSRNLCPRLFEQQSNHLEEQKEV